MTHTFTIDPVSRFPSAAIRRPREIACFSYDENHQFRLDASSLRYYYPPALPADLSRGFDTFRSLDDTDDDHLDGLLEALVAHERSKGSRVDADFVTWRGMATKIMTVPFSRLDEWEMNATLFQGTVFVEENHAKKLEDRAKQYSEGAARGNMSQDLMSFWGYKFETLSLLSDHWSRVSREEIEGREERMVSNYAQYCSIVRTGFGKLKMILGGEVDAVMDYKPDDPSMPVNWVELKTTAEVRGEKDQVKLERKLLKFWAQSFLLGVPRIIVGYRTQQGTLQRLEEMDTQSIPEKVRVRGKNMWSGDACIAFTGAFLQWLSQTITTDGVWRIRKRPNIPVLEVFKVEETGHGDILSRSFVEWRLNELPKIKAENSDQGKDSNGAQAGPVVDGEASGSLHELVDVVKLKDAREKLLASLQQNGSEKPP